MGEEFNIFKNLDVLRRTNLLDELKTLETANNSNAINCDENGLDDDEFDFDTLLNNNVVKSPTKRSKKTEDSAKVNEKKSKRSEVNRFSISSTDSSLSSSISLVENLSNNVVNDAPVGRRTRRSLDLSKKSAEQTIAEDNVNDVQTGTSTRRRGRGNAAKNTGRGRGKGRGRGRGRKSLGTETRNDDSFMSNDSPNSASDADYEPHEPESRTAAAVTSASIMEQFLQRGRRGRSQNMRARRNYIAEIAARSTQVDFIDLVSSPFPRVEGSITLDSESEEERPRTRSRGRRKKSPKKKPQAVKNPSLDISLDDDNPELSVKINWKGNPEAFKLRKYQKFSAIFKILAEREGTDLENVVFNLNERIVAADDTPDSIDYKIFQFINGRVLAANHSAGGGLLKKQRNANQINLKIQSDKWKRPLHIDIQKTDKFRILYIKCAEELNVGIEQIKLSFDGEVLELNDTPANQDLEGGEAIDLRLRD